LVSAAPSALLVLGGSYHDFGAFEAVARSALGSAGLDVDATFELATLARLHTLTPSLVVLCTCLDETSGASHTPHELAALSAWVRRGGGLLALHSATVSAAREPVLEGLLGAAFAGHPPKRRFRVEPSGAPHPSTAGIAAFELEDELYRHRGAPDGDVHLVALDDAGPQPVAWSRREQAGRVYYLGLGHDESAWSCKPYRTLLAQAARWLAGIARVEQ
jgi:type 1 glutamine amidotransferase